MKNLKLFVFAIISFLVIGVNVNAETVSTWDELKTCLTTAGTATCETDAAITALNENITVVGEKTLILGEKLTISKRFKLDNGTKLVVKGDVTTTGQFMFMAEAGSSLTLEEGTFTSTLRGTPSQAAVLVSVFGSNVSGASKTLIKIDKEAILNDGGVAIYKDRVSGTAAYGVVIDVYGKISMTKNAETGVAYNVFTTNGYITAKSGDDLPVINFYEGSKVTNEGAPAIYAAGYAIWNIKGGEFTGSEALSIKAGKFNITGGTFTANGEYVSPEQVQANNNGTEKTGAAISITGNDGYANGVELNIENAIVESENGYALFEGITKGTIPPVKNITISGGEYSGEVEAVYAENAVNFIEGGKFNTDVATYVDSTTNYKKVGDTVYVGEAKKVNIVAPTNGTVTADLTSAIEGETVTLTIKANDGYEVDTISVEDVAGRKIAVTSNKFTMPSTEVGVIVTFKKVESQPVVNPDNGATNDTTTPEIPEVPGTLDNIAMFVALGFMSVAVIGISMKNLKKRTVK